MPFRRRVGKRGRLISGSDGDGWRKLPGNSSNGGRNSRNAIGDQEEIEEGYFL
jgi:hypothetical protein